MLNTKFNYDAVNSLPFIVSDDGQVVSVNLPDSDFIGLLCSGSTNDEINDVTHMILPFHEVIYFSIKNTPTENLEKTWNLLVDIFIRYKLPYVTMIKRGKCIHKIDENLRGREIAIFMNNNIHVDMQSFLQEAITLLVKENIAPGYQAINVKYIQGSNYNGYENFKYIDSPQNSEQNRKNIASFFSMSLPIPTNLSSMTALNILMAKKLLLEVTHKN